MDTCVKLAKETIKYYLENGQIIKLSADCPKTLLNTKAGVFVSLHKKSDHSLRGCIGTFLPTRNCVAEEIINNAIAAATEDPRFMPLTEKELTDLEINVDILSSPEPVTDTKKLNPKKYGLIVSNQNGHKGLLLPDIGVDTVEEQIAICCEKGGINPAMDTLSLSRFTVERHK